jgi:hypothetical protein
MVKIISSNTYTTIFHLYKESEKMGCNYIDNSPLFFRKYDISLLRHSLYPNYSNKIFFPQNYIYSLRIYIVMIDTYEVMIEKYSREKGEFKKS